ncbi:MAG: dihydrodipicolinate reductase [Novosphingobium sp.]
MARYRVIQWATGNVGSRALRMVIEHPDMDLVGLWVSNPDKVGKDAGDLAGAGVKTGILATNSAADLIATPADCVLYMRQGTDIEELCAILASGKNVVTTRGDFHNPRLLDPAVRSQIEAACAKGKTSVYSTGSSPGFITEALAIPLLAQQRRHDCITINEYADMASRNSPEMIFQLMGFGEPIGPMHPGRVEHLKYDFGNTLSQLADAIGLECDEIYAMGEQAAALNDKQIAAGLIKKGSVAAMRITIEARHEGKAVARICTHWYCSDDIAEDWGLRESGWKVVTEGDTPIEVNITFPVSEEEYPLYTPGLTAHRPVNAIPMVCRAAPGIRTTCDMEQVIPRFS